MNLKMRIAETGLDEENFPESCEYSLDEILGEGFYPE
jgi:hypothetical protein